MEPPGRFEISVDMFRPRLRARCHTEGIAVRAIDLSQCPTVTDAIGRLEATVISQADTGVPPITPMKMSAASLRTPAQDLGKRDTSD
ncbi:hypothetical protein [Bradyrhizobium sp. LB13.1]